MLQQQAEAAMQDEEEAEEDDEEEEDRCSKYRWTHSPCADGMRVNDLPLSVLQQQAEAAMQYTRSALGDGGSVLVCVHTHTCCLNT